MDNLMLNQQHQRGLRAGFPCKLMTGIAMESVENQMTKWLMVIVVVIIDIVIDIVINIVIDIVIDIVIGDTRRYYR